ncbi:DUF6492 family protein [Hoeflea sp. TYP-13]|uniref:DUF6492 family protein n=1 Tax=Hoeflea sp. TYP-13 TaxID=3230023 RepID=UPI0034C6D128
MRTAVVTASYAADFERCRLLCDSMDMRLKGDWSHYILVEQRDVARFKALQSARRRIVDEREILPDWLRPFPDPLTLGKRRVWLGPHAVPLRGWHVQQLRRLGMGRLLDEAVIFSADSDVALLREFDPADLWEDGRLRLYRRDDAITASMAEHVRWVKRTDALLGHEDGTGSQPYHDYINTLIGWRTDALAALLDRIEKVSGVNWMRAIARNRAISECTLYGRFVDGLLNAEGHVHCAEALCHVMWLGNGRPDRNDLQSFIRNMEPHQIGIGIQSFIGYDLNDIRQIVLP